ncbi:hypothetical protein DM02DRAFT_653982 [Periconia macrospinosa]|uniref:Uncharacterized protein n=1 Tax=Periconia macrospinosa TaxID=97972 RepID=A0A2V1DVJ7_9PLEO|nr:hypothetical protein DM02DRAFT_653982 [Periconia macrospinosa]
MPVLSKPEAPTREAQHLGKKPKLEDWQLVADNRKDEYKEEQRFLQNVRLWYNALRLADGDQDDSKAVQPPSMFFVKFDDNYDGPRQLLGRRALVINLSSTDHFDPKLDTEWSFDRKVQMQAILYCLDSVKGVSVTGTNNSWHLKYYSQDKDEWVVNGGQDFSRMLITAWDDFVKKRSQPGFRGKTRVKDAVFGPGAWADIGYALELYRLPHAMPEWLDWRDVPWVPGYCRNLVGKQPILEGWEKENPNKDGQQADLNAVLRRWLIAKSYHGNMEMYPGREPWIEEECEEGKKCRYYLATSFEIFFRYDYSGRVRLMTPAYVYNVKIDERSDILGKLYLLDSMPHVFVHGEHRLKTQRERYENYCLCEWMQDNGMEFCKDFHRAWNDFIDMRNADGGKSWVKDPIFGVDQLSFDVSHLLTRFPDAEDKAPGWIAPTTPNQPAKTEGD